jgi:uncharacterized membrane protein YdjX (TVP38/TMEM64 family)
MRKRILLFAALIAVAITIGSLIMVYGASLDLAAIAARLRGEWWGPLAYLAAYVLLGLFLVPTQALSIAAPLIWGWKLGGAIELVSASVGAIAPYLLARSTARPWVERRMEKHRKLAAALNREGFTFVLLLRVIPIVPYPVLNYLAGCSTVRFVSYMTATIIGTIPSVFVFAYFVDAIAAGVMRPREVMLRVVGAGVLLGAFVLVIRYSSRLLQRRLATPSPGLRPPSPATAGEGSRDEHLPTESDEAPPTESPLPLGGRGSAKRG